MLRGERVVVRALARDDLRRQWEWENDAEIWFLDGSAPRAQQLERLLADFDESMSKPPPDGLDLAIEADGLYIGHCSLHSFDATARSCELGIEIGDRAYWGKGYGREVVRLLLGYAFVHRNLNRVALSTHSENERALRCYRACGFREEGRLRQSLWLAGHHVDTVHMAILREEWTA